jgi:BirA family biotin operon repressor/biotin-[acetyl-CoA-carboxylase] ligase
MFTESPANRSDLPLDDAAPSASPQSNLPLDDSGDSAPLCILDETTSTNDVAKDAALAGAPNGYAVAAHRQTAGRGRRGHAWSSVRDAMCISVVLRPAVPMPFFVALPAVATLGVMRTLRDLTGLGTRVAIKWPNDLIAFDDAASVGEGNGRKLGGMLVEAGSDGNGPFAVAGQGINLWRDSASAAKHADADAQHASGQAASRLARGLKPTSLEELVGVDRVPAFDELAEALQTHIVLAVGEWAALVHAGGPAPTGPLDPILPELYDSIPALGHQVVAISPAGAVIAHGTFAGIDGWGRARIVLSDGSSLDLSAEQASLRRESSDI